LQRGPPQHFAQHRACEGVADQRTEGDAMTKKNVNHAVSTKELEADNLQRRNLAIAPSIEFT
jgi:hypothetical protein